MNGRRSRLRKRLRRAASSRPTHKSRQPGPNTACETPLYPSGAGRSRLDPRVYCLGFPTRGQRRIHEVIDLLLSHPEIGIGTDDPVIRRLTTPPYPFLIFYEIAEDEIIVHAIRHAARDPSGMPGST